MTTIVIIILIDFSKELELIKHKQVYLELSKNK